MTKQCQRRQIVKFYLIESVLEVVEPLINYCISSLAISSIVQYFPAKLLICPTRNRVFQIKEAITARVVFRERIVWQKALLYSLSSTDEIERSVRF